MTFRKYINESKTHLDISIQSADKFLTSNKKITDLLSSEVTIEHKTDGVKLQVIKIADKGNINDYIFAYKNNILYSHEYDYQVNAKISSESIGASQFKKVFQHFSNLESNTLPIGTELFIEFLMSKPTLSSNYLKKHKMILIGYSQSTYSEQFGKLSTQNSGMQTELRTNYAKELKIDVPQLLFKGVMSSEILFEKGIVNKKLKYAFANRKMSMNWNTPNLLLDDLKEMFLSLESKYGGIEEGVVIYTNSILLKWQQDYQLDQEARSLIKMKYKEDNADIETQYWNNVKSVALELSSNIVVKSRKLDDILTELSLMLKRQKILFNHSKKTITIIKDDIQLNAKTLLIKKMRGNNNALVVGKFRVLTKTGHYKLIKRASSLYDNVVVCIVSNKNSNNSKEIRTEMMQKVFPNVKIVHAINGNLRTILNKAKININVVYTGTDRVNDYKKQLQHSLGTDVREMLRTENDISASKVIDNISNKEYFEKNTPDLIHSFYNELLDVYE